MPETNRIQDTRRMTSMGQVLIPSYLRKLLSVNPGDDVVFSYDPSTNRLYIEGPGRSDNSTSQGAIAQ